MMKNDTVALWRSMDTARKAEVIREYRVLADVRGKVDPSDFGMIVRNVISH